MRLSVPNLERHESLFKHSKNESLGIMVTLKTHAYKDVQIIAHFYKPVTAPGINPVIYDPQCIGIAIYKARSFDGILDIFLNPNIENYKWTSINGVRMSDGSKL